MSLQYIQEILDDSIKRYAPTTPKGRVLQVAGTVIKAIAPRTSMGEVCILQNPGSDTPLHAEVIGFDHNTTLLAPMGEMRDLSPSTKVTPTGDIHRIKVGPHLRGRVLNGMGEPIDHRGIGDNPLVQDYSVNAFPPDPLSRTIISRPIQLGVKAIDAFTTCGEGQRTGIFSAAGAGKSTLLGMLVRHASVDITIVALIGERGREVREFIEQVLGPEGMKNTIIVVATSDRPAMERVKAAHVATTIAEYFRDQGMKVLLLMDSITRFARAQREIGLSAGEAPTRRGFPPSVFAELPRLMERAGTSDKGSITAFYTVLVEGDDMNEPVADEVRSILDGHIILSRELADANHFPAIDILASLSRVMQHITAPEHQAAASKLRSLMAKYKEIELLIRVGEYQAGSDPEADEAIAKINAIKSMVKQDIHHRADFEMTLAQMKEIAET
jgi:type III secretion protein N (ATPase)